MEITSKDIVRPLMMLNGKHPLSKLVTETSYYHSEN